MCVREYAPALLARMSWEAQRQKCLRPGRIGPPPILNLAPLFFHSTQSALAPPLLTRDAALLARLLYRNKAQHRGSAHYTRLVGLSRALQRLAGAGGSEALAAALASGQASAVRAALRALLATAAAASSVVDAASSAASAASAPLARSYFPALATAGLALAARAAALGCGVALAAAASFNAAAPLAGLPPPSWAKEEEGEEEKEGEATTAVFPAVVAVEWVTRGRRGGLPVPRVVGKGGRLDVRAVAQMRRAAGAVPSSDVGVPVDRAAFEGRAAEVEVEAPPPPPLAVFDDHGGGQPPLPPSPPPAAPPPPPPPLIGQSKSAAKRAAAKARAVAAAEKAAAAARAKSWEGWVGGGSGAAVPPPRKKGRR